MLKMERKRGVFLFFGVFFVVIIIWLVKSFFSPMLTLNEKAYGNTLNYEASLVKSQKFAKSADGMTIDYIYEANTVVLRFPSNEPAPVGRVVFSHSSNRDKERGFELKTDPSKQMFIQLNDFDKGRWRVLVEWQGEATVYNKEVSIDVQPNDWARPPHK